jgi:hypothetical protein
MTDERMRPLLPLRVHADDRAWAAPHVTVLFRREREPCSGCGRGRREACARARCRRRRSQLSEWETSAARSGASSSTSRAAATCVGLSSTLTADSSLARETRRSTVLRWA